MADLRPACLYWGPERIALYNEHFKVIVDSGHPRILGAPFKVAFPELVDYIGPVFSQVEATGNTVVVNEFEHFTGRRGPNFLEEAYFTGQFIPFRDDDGKVGGFLNAVYESTKLAYDERWRQLTNAIASLPNKAEDSMVAQMIDALREFPRDVPMAIFYACDQPDVGGSQFLHLRGTIGVPNDHIICRNSTMNVSSPKNSAIARIAKEAIHKRELLVLDHRDPRLYDDQGYHFDGVQWTGFQEPSRKIGFAPIQDMSGEILGLLVIGTNPRRVFDQDAHFSLIEMIRHTEAKWAASISFEEALKREENLNLRLTDTEKRLRNLAHAAPFGMLQIASHGKVEWANEQTYEITGHPKEYPNPDIEEFLKVIVPEDRDLAKNNLDVMFAGARTVTTELKLNRTWSPPPDLAGPDSNPPGQAWILFTGFSVLEGDQVKMISGFITDISKQKWAEAVQSRNADSALRAKRQQEEFIDTISHELRNPLMAMTQLAEGVGTNLEACKSSHHSDHEFQSAIESSIADVKTILTCTEHQKRIVDDVLVLSRLETDLLSIKLVSEQPRNVVNAAVRMFTSAAAKRDSVLRAVEDSSLISNSAEHVLCDPSRLLQALNNLIGNAVKFTTAGGSSEIVVTYGAQVQTPVVSTRFGDILWLPRMNEVDCKQTSMSSQEKVNVFFAIQDSGPGLEQDEINRLFRRFSQVSTSQTPLDPSASYEGSELGLYIVRQLVEKLGGQVGIVSRPGEGSAFGFFISTTRAEPTNVAKTQDKTDVPPTVTTNTLSKRAKASPREEPLRVILAEDNLINLKVLSKQLKNAGCIVTTATNGAEVLDRLQHFDCWAQSKVNPEQDTMNHDVSHKLPTVDIILLDWQMPVMDGLTCARKIRELQSTGTITKHVPILSITANARQEQVDLMLAAGVDAVLVKPFTSQDLVSKIQEVLEKQ